MTRRRRPLSKATRPVAPIIPVKRRVPVLELAGGPFEAWISVARLPFLNDRHRVSWRQIGE